MGADLEWDGLSQTIKKQLDKNQEKLMKKIGDVEKQLFKTEDKFMKEVGDVKQLGKQVARILELLEKKTE